MGLGFERGRCAAAFKNLMTWQLNWSKLLPDDKQAYLNRIIQFTSHSTLSNEVVAEPSGPEKNTVGFLLNHLVSNYGFWQQEKQNG